MAGVGTQKGCQQAGQHEKEDTAAQDGLGQVCAGRQKEVLFSAIQTPIEPGLQVWEEGLGK